MRKLSERGRNILAKLAPELKGAAGPAPGHEYQFILLPVSHKVAESPEDMADRVNKLDDEELSYLIDLILREEEDVRSLSEGDFDAILEIIEKRLPERAQELKR